jgi:hypothetical protein
LDIWKTKRLAKTQKQEVPEHKSEPKTDPENKPTKEESAKRSSKPPKKASCDEKRRHEEAITGPACVLVGTVPSDDSATYQHRASGVRCGTYPKEGEAMKKEWQR